ncbi:predicted protein [Naegleria gruberi]|uniref:Predicted protein n=1 Tax=Naegleria gruberi TaxID=5762 RepID=D2VSW2_NAEGR|nr:uncharacterized protein NAEGRDRAFT_72082 [Naegleria gruberi]EFC39970.1 predicted protein [Naegleria gruberi]|eukprot:XP_002672714.1 predicted protein [Naegleria gruberi strain NEG-M]
MSTQTTKPSIVLFIRTSNSSKKQSIICDHIRKMTFGKPHEGNALLVLQVGSEPILLDDLVIKLKGWKIGQHVSQEQQPPHFVHTNKLRDCLQYSKGSTLKNSSCTFNALDVNACNQLEKGQHYAIRLSDVKLAFLPPSLDFDQVQVEIFKKDQLVGAISHSKQEAIDSHIEMSAKSLVSKWKTKSRYEHLDLIDGVGAADFIVINVDALISMALKKSNGLDWKEHGGQWLHLVWLCEKMLSLLKSRNVNFDLICFKNSIIMDGNFSFFVARMIVFNHLKKYCTFPCYLFDSLLSKEWEEYIRQANPSAVISSDCNYTNAYLNLMSNISYIVTNVEEGAKSVLGDVYSSAYLSWVRSVEPELDNLSKFLQNSSISSTLKIREFHQLENVMKQVNELQLHSNFTRLEVFLSSFLLFIENCKQDKVMESLFYGISMIYSVVLLDYLPIEARHCNLKETINELTQFMQELYKYCSMVLFEIDNFQDISCDLLDCRLIHWLILNFKPNNPFTLNQWIEIICELSPQPVKDSLNKIVLLLKERVSFDFDSDFEFSSIVSPYIRNYAYDYSNSKNRCTVLEVKNNFINTFCNLQSSSVIQEDSFKKPLFYDIYHFHSTRLITDTAEHLERNKYSTVDKTREKLNGMVELFKKVNKCKEIATEQVPKDLKFTEHVNEKNIMKIVSENYEKSQKPLNAIKEIIRKQESLVKKKEDEEETFSISELVSISLTIQENIQQFIPIMGKYSPKNNTTMVFGKKLYIQLLDSFKYQLPKSRKPIESKLLQRTVEGPTSKISLNELEEQKAMYRLYHVNSWIRFIYSYLMELNSLCLYFTEKEIAKELENLATSARMFGFCQTAQLIENEISPKKISKHEEDIIDPNYLFLYHFEKTAPTTPPLERFTKKKHNQILNELVQEKVLLIEKLKKDSSTKSREEISHEIKKVNVNIKLRESLTFTPDDWQNQLISYVNRDESVLVSVPTSNGKTFIVFYLIEKVLRESENGVVLFVVPNKALVNQVYCEIQSRLKKNQNNMATAGMATANTRLDVFNSQLLVIVPAMLEIYLMSSAPKVLEWRKRIKYLVLDEIHCITSDDQGEYYEHCIQLLDCPVIGLSATLGNSEKFAKWMTHGSRDNVHLIYEPDYKRFNPLEYHNFNGTEISHSHPCELFNPKYLNEKEIQKCRMMTIDECFQLKRMLLEIDQSDEMKEIIETHVGYHLLNRNNQLSCITWNDHIQYKLGYKQLMIYLVNHPTKHKVLSTVVSSLQMSYADENIKPVEFVDDMIHLIIKMKKEKMLPSIVFILDRRMIDLMVRTLLHRNVYLYENEEDCPRADILRLNIDDNDSEKTINRYYIDALSHGIGAHYAGMNDGYLIEIERLFREKKLPLIFTTSTLALGIHLPCKTVVMAGSSIYLTNSLFKQCCGRVGRRGIDQKGKVILYGLSKPRIRRYLLSEPISINGTVGLKPSFILKMFTSLNQAEQDLKSGEKNPFQDAFQRVLEKPLFSINENTMIATQSQMSYFIRFHTEFLRQAMFLNKKCNPLQLSGLIGHLHYREPFNFLMAHFLQTRIFEMLDINKIREHEFDKIILTIFTLLFARYRVGKHMSQNTLDTDFTKNMSNIYRKMIEKNVEFNNETLGIYSNYAIAYCLSEKLKDETLPLSDYSTIILKECESECKLFTELKKSRSTNTHSISSFSALSGNEDGKYLTEDHFFSTLKHTISINKAHVPFTSALSDEDHPISCFLLDYYGHGSLKILTEDHQFINIGASSKLISEAIRDLKKLRASLINEEIFSFSISDYERKLDSGVVSEWLVKECPWLKNNPNLELITFEKLYNWLTKNVLEIEVSALFPIRGNGLKMLKRKIENRFAHPIIQSLDRILSKLEEGERRERQQSFNERKEIKQKKQSLRNDLDSVESFKGIKHAKSNFM